MEHDAIDRSKSVLAATEPWFPFSPPEGATTHLVIALAGVARCRRLLAGMIDADDDLGGVFARTLFETWLHAIYAFLGEAEALDRMALNDDIYVHRNAERMLRLLPEGDPETGSLRRQALEVTRTPRPTGELSAAAIAEKVRLLLEARGDPNAAFPVRGYAFLYGPESYMSVHGGLGALDRHVERLGDSITISPSGRTYIGSGRRLDVATALVGTLASKVAEPLGLDRASLDDVLLPWLTRMPETE